MHVIHLLCFTFTFYVSLAFAQQHQNSLQTCLHACHISSFTLHHTTIFCFNKIDQVQAMLEPLGWHYLGKEICDVIVHVKFFHQNLRQVHPIMDSLISHFNVF